MHINDSGLELIKKYEGFESKAYVCPAGRLTIGYGHTGDGVTHGMVITRERAEELLLEDVNRFEQYVAKSVTIPLTSNQFSALVAFTFNVGTIAFQSSTLLSHLNAGRIKRASREFEKWCHVDSKVLKGLLARRLAEKELFLCE